MTFILDPNLLRIILKNLKNSNPIFSITKKKKKIDILIYLYDVERHLPTFSVKAKINK